MAVDSAGATGAPPRVDVGGMLIDPVTESQVLDAVSAGWRGGVGGLIVTPNVDIWRIADKDPAAAAAVAAATFVIPDGQPLLWAAKLAGDHLPERVTGSGLIERLCARAAAEGAGVYIIGGGADDSVAELAATALASRYAGLRVVGHSVPPFGFERDPQTLAAVVDPIVDSGADLVLVGLGFPKQEKLALAMRERMPRAWFLGCGGGIQMSAGLVERSPEWAQRAGVEWVVRLVQEPGRLAHRYLIDDIPAALRLLGMSGRTRWQRRRRRSR